MNRKLSTINVEFVPNHQVNYHKLLHLINTKCTHHIELNYFKFTFIVFF